ncbi:MAG: PQQ-like beta-propeller repeat protein, partial [Bacteroidia bacterium]|nr:PQQ-like beta-propeller repeat protein [Bacteroidia bacterium]
MKILKSILAGILLLIVFNQSFAQKVYQWRGQNRDGIYSENKLMKVWPEKGPTLLWFNEQIGAGFAAPVVTNDKVLINGEADSTSYLIALDLKGKLLWKAPNGREYYGKGFSASYPGSRSTPTVVGDLVYATSGNGWLACFELATGKEKWAVNMVADLGGLENEFGYSESPLIDGDNVYCMPGGKIQNVVALNRFTGKTTWTSKATADTTSFCSPILISLPSRKIFVSLSHHYIFGVDAKNGELLWSQKLENFRYDGEHCSTPVFADGFLYYIVADENGNGAVKLELSPDGKNIKEIWRNRTATNAMGGYVKINNQLFTTTNKKKLICIDTNTGSVLDSLSSNKGSLIYADNRFYCYSETGDVKLIKFENKKLAEISKFRLDKGTREHFSHPVIANGTMYIRHGKALMAYDIKE